MEQLRHIELEFREGASDKVYRAGIEKSGTGFVVNFAYGRRGTTLNTGTKTLRPVTYAEAEAVYKKLILSKTAKGYKPVDGSSPGIGSTVTDRDRRDSGLRPQLLNPVNLDEAEAYLNDDQWCVQEKFDGRRILMHKSGTELVAVNRDGLCVGFPQAFATLASVEGDYVIDGESVGEMFYAFDLLENATGDKRLAPYRARLAALQAQFGRLGDSIVIAETVYGNGKRKFMEQIRSANKEGAVFKDLDAVWTAGRPASGGSAMKCKFWATCSCVVMKVNARRSIEVALGGKSVGNVTIPLNHDVPAIGQAVEIRYLYVNAPGGSLYQPIYLGQRDDVKIEDCTEERQHLKYRPAA